METLEWCKYKFYFYGPETAKKKNVVFYFSLRLFDWQMTTHWAAAIGVSAHVAPHTCDLNWFLSTYSSKELLSFPGADHHSRRSPPPPTRRRCHSITRSQTSDLLRKDDANRSSFSRSCSRVLRPLLLLRGEGMGELGGSRRTKSGDALCSIEKFIIILFFFILAATVCLLSAEEEEDRGGRERDHHRRRLGYPSSASRNRVKATHVHSDLSF